ncbi:MAG: tetratricopeptide repeat protein [Sedimentisphaerales bacterium]
MRKTIYFLLLCVFSCAAVLSVQKCVAAQGEGGKYPELEAVEKYSHDKVFEYINRYIREDKILEGVIDYALKLQFVFDGNDAPEKYTSAYLYAAYGEVAYSDIYFLLGSINVDEKTREELDNFKDLRDKLYEKLNSAISEGIKLHDEGQYEKAIEIYDRAIAQSPNSALLYYEKGLSYLMESQEKSDPNLKDKALETFKVCREKDPFFSQAYQGDDPNVINKLDILMGKVAPFYSGEKRDIESYAAFAEGCEEMQLYPFAAHAQLKLSLIDPKNTDEHIAKFFDMIEKSGCKGALDLKEMFVLKKDVKTPE